MPFARGPARERRSPQAKVECAGPSWQGHRRRSGRGGEVVPLYRLNAGTGSPASWKHTRHGTGQTRESVDMKVGAAIAEIMKREGVEVLLGYPVNHLIEFAAAADIRPVMVRQERIGL